MVIKLIDIPKISLNQWYAGKHWSNRKKIKDAYKLIVKSQFKRVLSKNKQYDVKYDFFFDKRPLDASNCVAMVKMIEDIIFESDSYKIVKKITITSNKSEKSCILVKIKEL